jgi:hypothetical protein
VFLFARHFISGSFLVVGQILIAKRQAFGFDVSNLYKYGKKRKSQYWTQKKA